MRNIRLTIAFDGTNYYGWQKQKDKPTIAGILEDAIFNVCKERVRIIGQGRIDKGAHAIAQVATFKTETTLLPLSLKKALNSFLPNDIIIKCAEDVELLFNPRHAKERRYRYVVLNQASKSPLFLRYSYFFPFSLDVSLIKEGARAFIGKKDFSSFIRHDERNPVREIKSLDIIPKEGLFGESLIFFDIVGTSFLYNMIRSIVAILIRVGEGRLPVADIPSLFLAKDRRCAPFLVPSCGLFLMEVNY